MVPAAFSAVDLRQILSFEPLPAMPRTAVQLESLARNASNGPAEFAVVIEGDPGLTAQLLRFVNSSYFGFRSEISSVKQAITLLGIRTIQNFVLWQAIFKLIPNPRCCLFDLRALWRDSLQRGLFARVLSKRLGMPDPEEAFAAALLQDMAIPLLALRMPEDYSRFFFARSTSAYRARLSQLEEHVFGWNHAMVAGAMARQWQLPETLAALIESHLVIEQDLFHSRIALGRLAVAMSALVPADDDEKWSELSKLAEAYSHIRPSDGPTIEELLRKVDEEFAEIAPILQMSAARISLAEKYRNAAAAENRSGG